MSILSINACAQKKISISQLKKKIIISTHRTFFLFSIKRQAKRVVLYLARARPERLVDEMMTELQTVETLNCLIERTQTPPFYRLTSMRKASSHSDAPTADPGNPQAKDQLGQQVEKGTIHTKRHSGEDPVKTG